MKLCWFDAETAGCVALRIEIDEESPGGGLGKTVGERNGGRRFSDTPLMISNTKDSFHREIVRKTAYKVKSKIRKCRKETDGIPNGTYKVYITGAEEGIESLNRVVREKNSMGEPVTRMPQYRQLVDQKYMTAQSTPLTCDVLAPNNRFDITVEKPAK
ncbi:hypothetical protein FACS1894189_0500 [Planctomycetales bacterium]|nr:hypothetical protein FACS1894189_0500 [Planctomycetales bacterium]